MRFINKVVLVTGAGSGIGKAAAMRFAEEGANVVVVDKNYETAYQTAAEIKAIHRRALAIYADVTNFEELKHVGEMTIAEFHKLDVVFANAGISGGNVLLEMDPEDWNQVIQVNLTGIFLTCKMVAPLMIQTGGEAIVTMASSMAGWDTSLSGAAYMASKEGVIGLTKSLALQLARYQIRVNAVCPGIIRTNLGWREGMNEADQNKKYERFENRIPLRRVGDAEDVAAAVAFLASKDARHVTGSALLIDGGQTLQSWSNAPEGDMYPPIDFSL